MSFLVMPFASDVAVFYAKEAPNSDNLFMNPTVGWISGFDLSTDSSAKVFDGVTGQSYGDKAVALHICLPDDKMASLGIVNIFIVDENDSKIEFAHDALSVTKCLVGGKEVVLSEYLTENKVNTQLPLIADYNSVLVNVSIKSVSEESKTVDPGARFCRRTAYRLRSCRALLPAPVYKPTNASPGHAYFLLSIFNTCSFFSISSIERMPN